ncbi:unnamed protein product [marine sediment metagenome]|uniref:Uncharacterized protein n=1 Tax=marine sediment metagenome TaxID=412755 RepID=X1P7B9_9ZZZZ
MIPTDANNLLDFHCPHCKAGIVIAPIFHIFKKGVKKGIKCEAAAIFSISGGEARLHQIVYDGREYSFPSGAGKKITGYQVRGPTFWKFKTKKGNIITLAQLTKL